MQPGCGVEEQGRRTVMHQAGRLFQGLQLPGLGKWAVSTGAVARAGSWDAPRGRGLATHTDGHAGWGGALLPRYKQVLHLHLALQFWGLEASVAAPRSGHPWPCQTPQIALPASRLGALTSALCHLDLQELLSMVGDRIGRSGHRAEGGAGAGGRDIPQGLIEGECVQRKGAPTPRGPTQPSLLAAQRGACTSDEGLCFHGRQQEWVWLLRETEPHNGSMAFALRPPLPPPPWPPLSDSPSPLPLPSACPLSCSRTATSFS